MEYLNFTVDSALLRELGEKLVESVHLALAELIKNSYDADATEVTVRFTQDDKGNDEIHIIDNGIGMNFREVEEYWMRIATTNKNQNRLSRLYGRPKTGEKGIGRFCCRRLGARLRLITVGAETRANSTEFQKTEVKFNWEEFEPGTEVTEIRCPGYQFVVENVKTGTTLIISELKDEWEKRGFNWLKRQLAILAANRGTRRPGYREDPGFNIILEAPEFEGGIRDIRDDLINAGWGTLTAHINKKHQAVCELEAMGIGRKTIISTETFPHLKDIGLKVGILVDERPQMRDTSVISKGTLSEILSDWGGVQVRYQGFRVYRFGDDDWLRIDRDRGLRKQQPGARELYAFAQSLRGIDAKGVMLNMLSMRSYVGNVEIGAGAEGFEMKANREGFLSSPAVDELRSFVRFVIDWGTIYREFYLKNKAQRESEEAREKLEERAGKKVEREGIIQQAVDYLQEEIKNIAAYIPKTQKKKFDESVTTAMTAILKYGKATQEELLHLRLIASTSTLLLIFSHEVKSLLGMLESSKNSLLNIEKTLSRPERSTLTAIREGFADLKNRFADLLEMTALVGVDSKKAQPMQLALRERIERAVHIFRLIIGGYDIAVDYDEVPNDIVIKSILEAELYAVLLNLLSNAIKSVIAAGGSKRIKIAAHREKGKNVIHFLDSGLGIEPSHYEDVFVPFLADAGGDLYQKLERQLNPEDKYIVGTGSGLGLGIVREIVGARNGRIAFIDPGKGWKAKLEIILP